MSRTLIFAAVPASTAYRLGKRIADVLIATLFLVMTLPLAAVVVCLRRQGGATRFSTESCVGLDGAPWLRRRADLAGSGVAAILRNLGGGLFPDMISILRGDLSLPGGQY